MDLGSTVIVACVVGGLIYGFYTLRQMRVIWFLLPESTKISGKATRTLILFGEKCCGCKSRRLEVVKLAEAPEENGTIYEPIGIKCKNCGLLYGSVTNSYAGQSMGDIIN
jgi:hypothetical protein